MGVPSGEHYFATAPDSPSERRTLRLDLPDLSLSFVTDRGVFSGDRVDPGTKLLLTESSIDPSAHLNVLDLGCGYGPIAVTMARRSTGTTVWAVDVNERALALTTENAVAAGVGDRVRAVAPDGVPAGVRFHAIFSNPPIRIGKGALHDLLESWLARMTPDGAARLVVHKHLGSDSLAAWLGGRGYAVERVASRMGYRLLEVTNRA